VDRQYRWPLRRAVRFRCRTCGARTRWFYVRRLAELGETVDSWQAWWDHLHGVVIHGRAVRR
jgi:hypothetical protein